MNNCITLREDLLIDLSALDFMLTDLNLYLDTHPCDVNALMLYNNVKAQADIYRNRFVDSFGPLTRGSTSCDVWNWIDNPWPWDRGGMC